MVSKWIKTGKAGWGAITGVKPGTRFKGQSTVKEIKEKGKQFKKKIVDKENRKKEFRKSGFYKYFTNQ